MLEYIAISAIASSIGALMTYVILKKVTSDDSILQKIDVITAEVMQNEEFQKRIYSIGALLGKGVIDGTGLKGKATGKRGIEGMIMEIIGNYIESRTQGQPHQNEPSKLGITL